MKRIALLLCALMMIAAPSLAQVPRCVLAEDCTATWCVYCPDAYAGLEVMRGLYDASEFMAVRLYDTSGDLGTTETHNRLRYYGVSAFPTVVFDGGNQVVGGGSEAANGNAYAPIVASDVGNPSPLLIRINSVNLTAPTGTIDCDVQAVMNIFDISHVKIRMVLMEDNVDWNGETMQYVTRDLLPDVALTVSQQGQIQNVVQSFPVDTLWKAQDLWMAVFAQNDLGSTVMQATSTRIPAYSPRYWASAPRGVFRTASSGLYEFPNFGIYNMGTNTDVIHVALDAGTIPPGWTCVFTDGTTDYTSADLPLNPGTGRNFHLKVTVGPSGYLNPKIVISSPNLPGKTKEIQYAVVTEGAQVLMVDDDGGQAYEAKHASALAAAGVTYVVWPTAVADVTSDLLAHFSIVDWETGLTFPTLTSGDQAALGTYLDNGGKLFISGTDIAAELANNGSLWWLRNYLHTEFMRDDTGFSNFSGVAGDPITDGMSFTTTHSLNSSPDEIAPYDEWATPILVHGPSFSHYKAGLKADTSHYKVVFLAFGFQSITAETDRNLLMQKVLAWLQSPSTAPVLSPGGGVTSIQAWPNPARGGAELHFVLARAGAAAVEIYGPDGALVRRLLEADRPAGYGTVRWDGRDEGGKAVPAGVYFYRIRAGSAGPTGRLVLTR